MPVQPDKRVEQIEFAESHGPVWEAQAEEIGLEDAEVLAIRTATNTARNTYEAAVAARLASKTATAAFYANTRDMHALVAAAILKIRAFAQASTKPAEVYALAEVPEPAVPSPQPPPGAATEIQAIVQPSGSLLLKFKASGGEGSVYLVRRKLPGQTSFILIGAAATTRGFRTFVDTTLPTGANNIQYLIQGQRGGAVGPEAPLFTVTLGGGGGGNFAEVRMAA